MSAAYFEPVAGGGLAIPADDKRFRVGSLELYAVVGGKKIYVSRYDGSFAMNAMGSARILIPFGEPCGPLAKSAIAQSASDLSAVLKRFTTIEVYVVPSTMELPDDGSVGGLLRPGTYRMIKGVIVSTVLNRSVGDLSAGAAAFEVEILSAPGIALSSGTSLFGPFAPDPGIGLSIIDGVLIAGASTGTIDFTAFWETGLKALLDLVFTTSRVQIAGRQHLETFRALAESRNVKELLKSVTSYLTYNPKHNTGVTLNLPHLQAYCERSLRVILSSSNVYSFLVELAQQMDFVVMDNGDSTLLFPYWPYTKSADIKVIPAGSLFHFRRVSSAFSGGQIPTGAIVTASAISIFVTGSDNTPYIGSYLWPDSNSSQQYQGVRLEVVPEYLKQATMYPADPDTPMIKVASGTTPADTTKTSDTMKVGAGIDGKRPAPGSVGISNSFAEFTVWENLFRTSIGEMILPLTDAIVPGVPIRVDVIPRADGEPSKPEDGLYVFPIRVEHTIDGSSLNAMTRVVISHIRNHDEQMKIEERNNTGLLFKDAYADTSKLRLWKPS